MNMLNSIILEGIVSDVAAKDTPHGKLVSFNLKVLRTYKKADGTNVDETSTFAVECWGRLAERLDKDSLPEGRGVRIVGRLKQNKWTDTDGKKHSGIVAVAEHVELKPMLRGHSQVEG